MFGGILHKGEKDEDWSVWDEYKAEMLAVRGLVGEHLVENVIDFDKLVLTQKLDARVVEHIRQQILETQYVGMPVRVRLVPANG